MLDLTGLDIFIYAFQRKWRVASLMDNCAKKEWLRFAN